MAKKKEEPKVPESVPPRKKHVTVMPCPHCRRPIKMRGVGNDCFSGECEDCEMEIEAVITKKGGLPTYEVYPHHGPKIEIPPDDYGFDSEPDNKGDKNE